MKKRTFREVRPYPEYRISDRGEPFKGKNPIPDFNYPDGGKWCWIYQSGRKVRCDLDELIMYSWHEEDPPSKWHIPIPIDGNVGNRDPLNWRWGLPDEHPDEDVRLDYERTYYGDLMSLPVWYERSTARAYQTRVRAQADAEAG